MRAAELRTVLGERDFRRLYATRLTSQLTDGMFQAALAGYVFFSPERQTSAARAAAAFAVLLLPYSAISPFVGVFIDRWSRRQILMCAPVARAALLLLIATLLLNGHDGTPFFLMSLLVIGVNRFFLAALSAALPHVVRQHLLVTANSCTVTSGTIIAFAGAGLGYLLRLAFGGGSAGTAAILACAAGCYLASASTAATLRRDQLGPDLAAAPPAARKALGNVLDGLADGARHVLDRRPAALALATLTFHRFMYGIVSIMTLVLCRGFFTTDPDAGLRKLAMMLGLSAAGFFAGAVITPPMVRRIGKHAWTTVLLASAAVTLLLFGMPFTEPAWATAALALGVVSQGVKLCVDTTLQESVDDAFRGRVFAVHDMLFNATFAAAAAIGAVLLPATGRSAPLLGMLIAVYALAALVHLRVGARSAPLPATGDTASGGASSSI